MGPGCPVSARCSSRPTARSSRTCGASHAARCARPAGHGTIDLFTRMADGDIKACWIICTNPIASVANRGTVIAGLEAAELVITQDAFAETETNAYADILLPAAMWAEGEGVMVSSERTLTLCPQVVDPPGEALPDWQLIARVAQRDGLRRRVLATHRRRRSSTRSVAAPTRRPATTCAASPTTAARRPGAVAGRARRPGPQPDPLPSLSTRRRAALPDPERPGAVPPSPARRRRAEQPDDDFPFTFNTGRLHHQWHTMTKTGKVAKLNTLEPGAVRRDPPRRCRAARHRGRRPGRGRLAARPGRPARRADRPGAAGQRVRAVPLERPLRRVRRRQRGDRATPSTRSRSSPAFKVVRRVVDEGGHTDAPRPAPQLDLAGVDSRRRQLDDGQRRYLAGFLAGVAAVGAGGHVPVLPAGAPFVPTMRTWIDGLLAGMFSRAPSPQPIDGTVDGDAGSRAGGTGAVGLADRQRRALRRRRRRPSRRPPGSQRVRAADGRRRAGRARRRAPTCCSSPARSAPATRPTTAPRSGAPLSAGRRADAVGRPALHRPGARRLQLRRLLRPRSSARRAAARARRRAPAARASTASPTSSGRPSGGSTWWSTGCGGHRSIAAHRREEASRSRPAATARRRPAPRRCSPGWPATAW